MKKMGHLSPLQGKRSGGRELQAVESQVYEKIVHFKMEALDGKMRESDAADISGKFSE